jgi:phenylpyruvate tautomerase PptA (4-oxalocrotonate tautomerase family)
MTMPMIDVYAAAGTFADKHQLAVDLATALMTIEQVPDIPMFRQNTAAFVHDLPAGALSNVDGDGSYVRIQVLTNAAALDRGKQLAVVERLTAIAADAAGDPTLTGRTWVLLTEAPDGGWGLAGHANTNEELVAAARAQIASLRAGQPAGGRHCRPADLMSQVSRRPSGDVPPTTWASFHPDAPAASSGWHRLKIRGPPRR